MGKKIFLERPLANTGFTETLRGLIEAIPPCTAALIVDHEGECVDVVSTLMAHDPLASGAIFKLMMDELWLGFDGLQAKQAEKKSEYERDLKSLAASSLFWFQAAFDLQSYVGVPISRHYLLVLLARPSFKMTHHRIKLLGVAKAKLAIEAGLPVGDGALFEVLVRTDGSGKPTYLGWRSNPPDGQKYVGKSAETNAENTEISNKAPMLKVSVIGQLQHVCSAEKGYRARLENGVECTIFKLSTMNGRAFWYCDVDHTVDAMFNLT